MSPEWSAASEPGRAKAENGPGPKARPKQAAAEPRGLTR